MKFADIDTAVDVLVEAIKTDYRDFAARGVRHSKTEKVNDDFTPTNIKMIDEFENGVSVVVGKKYIKILTGHSVWGFVVKDDTDKKFRKGDILKAASWASPARNSARGNVFDGYDIRWTGPQYLV